MFWIGKDTPCKGGGIFISDPNINKVNLRLFSGEVWVLTLSIAKIQNIVVNYHFWKQSCCQEVLGLNTPRADIYSARLGGRTRTLSDGNCPSKSPLHQQAVSWIFLFLCMHYIYIYQSRVSDLPIVSELDAELWLGVKTDPELGSSPDVCESGILLSPN